MLRVEHCRNDSQYSIRFCLKYKVAKPRASAKGKAQQKTLSDALPLENASQAKQVSGLAPIKESDGPAVALVENQRAELDHLLRDSSRLPRAVDDDALATAGPDIGAAPITAAASVDEAGLLDASPVQAARLGCPFPAGCPVWYRVPGAGTGAGGDGSGNPWDVRHGVVESLAMDAVTRRLVYRVRGGAGGVAVLVPKDRPTAYATGCRVEVTHAEGGTAAGEILRPHFAATGVSYTVSYRVENDVLWIKDGVLPCRIQFCDGAVARVEREEATGEAARQWLHEQWDKCRESLHRIEDNVYYSVAAKFV